MPVAARAFALWNQRFKVGRELETIFDVALKDSKAKSRQPPPPPPEDLSIATDKANLNLMRKKLKQDAVLKQGDLQLKAKELELKERELSLEEQK